jgi:hypothetical protein
MNFIAMFHENKHLSSEANNKTQREAGISSTVSQIISGKSALLRFYTACLFFGTGVIEHASYIWQNSMFIGNSDIVI